MTTQAHGQATAVYEIQFAYGFGRRTSRVEPGSPVKHGAELNFLFSRASVQAGGSSFASRMQFSAG